jgi:hypothetical protein
MQLRYKMILASLFLASVPWSAAHAHCGWGPRVGVGIGLGLPIGFGLGYGLGYASSYPYYYRPYYPVYVAPPPVIVQPAPVVQTVPAYAAPAVPAPAPAAPAPAPIPAPLTPTVANAPAASMPADADTYLQQMRVGSENARAEAMVELGRQKEWRAVGPMVQALNEDPSPAVREAAARGLGLIGAPGALTALQRAASADNDRDVRRSASFSAEVIRANMRR